MKHSSEAADEDKESWIKTFVVKKTQSKHEYCNKSFMICSTYDWNLRNKEKINLSFSLKPSTLTTKLRKSQFLINIKKISKRKRK